MTDKPAGYGQTAVIGAAATGIAQACRVVIQMVSTIVLARLLAPSDFGLVAMVAPIVAFVGLFQDIGLQQAIIQTREVTQEQISRLFWINVAMTSGVALIIAAIAPLAAWFYGEPRVLVLTMAWSIPVLMSAASTQHMTLLNRDLRFPILALIEVLASFAGLVAGVTLAWLLHSYWAIWASVTVAALTTALISWVATGWRPMSPFVKADIGHFVKFGINLAGFNFLNFFSRNLDNVIIAKWFGPVPLGFYDRAYKLLLTPIANVNAPVSRVMTPILGRLTDAPDRYRNAYVQAAGLVTWFCVPGILSMAIVSGDFVPFLLGERWAGAAPIFAWLGLAGFIQPLSNSTGWLFVSQHRTHDMFRWGLVSSSLTIASFFVGIPWGVTGVAASYALAGLFIRQPMLFWWVGRKGPVSTRDLWTVMLPVGVSGGMTYGFMDWLKVHAPLDSIDRILVSVTFCYGMTLIAILAVPSTRRWLLSSLTMFASSALSHRRRGASAETGEGVA